MSRTDERSDDIVRRGQALYDQHIRDTLPVEDEGKFLVLDVKSGDYAIDANDLAALRRARDKHPSGTFYILRIGSPAAYRIGRSGSLSQP